MPRRSYQFIAELIARDRASRELSKVNKMTKGTEKAFGALGKAVGVFGVGLTAGAIANSTWEMAQLGAEVQALESSFQRLGTEAGIATGKLMNEMRQASRGAIADAELLKNANRALAAGGAALAEELPALLNIARGASKATGEEFNYMLDSIVTGIARQSPMILDNLGLVVDLGDAYSAMASKLGKAASDLTKAEQITAVLQAVKDSEGAQVYGDIAKDAGDLVDKSGELMAMWDNVKATLGEEIAPPLTQLISFVNELLGASSEASAARKRYEGLLNTLKEGGEDISGLEVDMSAKIAELLNTRELKGATRSLALAKLYKKEGDALEDVAKQYEAINRFMEQRERAGGISLVGFDTTGMTDAEVEAELKKMKLEDIPILMSPDIDEEAFYGQAGRFGGNAGDVAGRRFAEKFTPEKAIASAFDDPRYIAPIEAGAFQIGKNAGSVFQAGMVTGIMEGIAGAPLADTSADQITDPMLKNLAKKLDEADLSLELSAVDAENYPQKLYDAVTSTQSNNWYELAGERIGERMGQSTMSQFTQIVIDNADGAAIEIYDAFEEAFMNALKGGSAAP